MGSLDDETKKLNTSMEPEKAYLTNLKTRPSPTIEEIDLHPTEKKLNHSSSSHSSSPDSPLDDPFHEDDDDDDKSSSSSESSPKHKSDPTPTPVSGNLVPKPGPSDLCSVSSETTKSLTPPQTEAPPTQVMEHPKSSYRIPSSVFARSKSNAPMEWSTASNESLFSIQMGNMSFINDSLFWRSGELGPPGEASTSGQMFSYSGLNNTASSTAADRRSRELGLAEATMKEVIRESENQNHQKKSSISEGRISHRSDGSNASTKSFAFPLLGADMEKGSSMSIASPVKGLREPKPRTPPSVKPKTVPPMSKPVLPQTEARIETKSPAAATGNVAQSNWFSRFSCCSFCL